MNVDEAKGCKTPLIDLLRGVPKDAHGWHEHHSTHHQHIPYGRLCNEAADEVERLQAALDKYEADDVRYLKNTETAESNLARLLRDLDALIDASECEASGEFQRGQASGWNQLKAQVQAIIAPYRPTADRNVSDRLIETNNES